MAENPIFVPDIRSPGIRSPGIRSPEIRLLTPEDAGALLAFERRNRDFFAAVIAARADDFFSEPGIVLYVQELLTEHAQKKVCPFVVMEAGEMIGRANLWQIDLRSRTAYVGYRVAEHCQGQGIATQSLKHLIQVATDQLGLQTLNANVLDNNPASAHVLEKQGFAVLGHTEQFLELNGQTLGCRHFQRSL